MIREELLKLEVQIPYNEMPKIHLALKRAARISSGEND